MTSDEFGDIEQLDENLRKWFKEKWVRFGPDGKIRGACARGDDSEGKPKCLPQKKAQNLGKKGRKYAASKKRREDPNPERTGKAKNVATKKKTNEDIPFNECPSCRGPIVHESMMTEKHDACYHKVKSRYKVWPSAYASGALVQCRKKGASNWGTGGKKKNESSIMKGIVDESENVLVLYIDGKPSAKYAIGHEAKTAMERLQAKFPNRKFELKREMREAQVGEAKAKPYVKPYNSPETGEQIGWVSSDGYHKKYWQKFAKDSAIKHAKLNPDEVQEDYTGMFAAENTPAINPYGGQKDRQHRGAISETPTDNPTGASGEGGLRKYRPKSADTFKEDELDEACWKGYHKEGNKKMFGKTYPNCVKNTNEEQIDEYREVSPELRAAQANLIAIRNKQKAVNVPSKKERITKDKVEIDKPKPASVLTKGSQDVDPDTMDAIAAFLAKGGEIKKGRPGKAPPVGRNQASLHIGGGGKFRKKSDTPGLGANYRGDKIVAVEEEQLDEKCWDTHKQVGMKTKGGKQVPNCVPKESAIMKGLKSL